MEQNLKYPVGIQTFNKIIEGGYVYIDKTDLIYKMVNEGEYYFISRPRRFGKSLLVTTLEAYFLGKKELFKGLKIEKEEKEWEQYPVFHLDLSAITYSSYEDLTNILESNFEKWESIYGKNPIEKIYSDRLIGLMERAQQKTGKHSVILIDEYDKPLTDTIGNTELQEKNRALLQGFYGVMKKGDRFIKFALLTGVTRYGKLGVFSANNNLRDISTVNDYACICGISEDELKGTFDAEVDILAKKLKKSKLETYDLLKVKYDGYHFSEDSKGMYNPFSLLNCLASKQIKNYWFATGTPSYLAIILKNHKFDPSQLEDDIKVTEETLNSFGDGESNVVAALYQSGYLTIKDYNGDYYTLKIPNEEVACGLTRYLIPVFSSTGLGDFDSSIIALQEDIKEGNANGLMEQLQGVMEEIPFENNEPKMIEAHFRNMVYLLIRTTGYPTHVEMPKLGGRLDVCFETEKYAYIIECKRDLDAASALAQIEEKKYGKRLSHTGKQLFKIGANFSSKEKNLVEWKIEKQV